MSYAGQGWMAGLCFVAGFWFGCGAVFAGATADYDVMASAAIISYLFMVLAVAWAWDLEKRLED